MTAANVCHARREAQENTAGTTAYKAKEEAKAPTAIKEAEEMMVAS